MERKVGLIHQTEKLVVAAGRAGIQEGEPARVTVENVMVAPAASILAHGLGPEIYFCECFIRGAGDILASAIPRHTSVCLFGAERLLSVLTDDSDEAVVVTAAGVEMHWKNGTLTCDFSDAVVTRQGEKPEKIEVPAPLPEPQTERRSEEEAELVPVRARIAR